MPGERTPVLSGFRPTSDLTVGNYFGAVKPALEIQGDPANELSVFVADLHGLTDHDPREIAPYRTGVIRDCVALGIDPDRTTLYLQSQIEPEVTQIANRIAPYAGVGELARTPNLKEKMNTLRRQGVGSEEDDDALAANYALLGYPVLMAADIYSQRAELVAVGEDQIPHLEFAREVARRFNNKFGEKGHPVLVEPAILAVDSVRIMSLDGKGKMSKSQPNQALMFTDDPDEARKKIRRATTAEAGAWNSVLESHFGIARGLASTPEQVVELDEIRSAHMGGEAVMGTFKSRWADIFQERLVGFQEKRAQISDTDVAAILEQGGQRAGEQASGVLADMRTSMGM